MVKSFSAQVIDSDEILVNPEVGPSWVAGTNNEFVQEITSKLVYTKEQCIEGTTVLEFTVDTFGQVTKPRIVRSVSTHIDNQLLKLITDYTFVPASLYGKKLSRKLYLPILIRLE